MARKLSARAQAVENARQTLLEQYSAILDSNEKVQLALLQVHEDDREEILEVEGSELDLAYELFEAVEDANEQDYLYSFRMATRDRRISVIESGSV